MPALPSNRLTPHGALAAPVVGARPTPRRRLLADPELVGAWDGLLDLTGVGAARHVPVRLVVRPDGRVTGEIGRARLVEATVRRARGWLARALGFGPEVAVVGRLEGAIDAGSEASPSRIRLPLARAGGELCGALEARGSTRGGPVALRRCGCGT